MKATFKIGRALTGKKSDHYEIRPDTNTTITDPNFYIWVPLKISSWVSAARFTYYSKGNYWWEVVMLDHSIDYEPLINSEVAHSSIVALFKNGIENLEKQ